MGWQKSQNSVARNTTKATLSVEDWEQGSRPQVVCYCSCSKYSCWLYCNAMREREVQQAYQWLQYKNAEARESIWNKSWWSERSRPDSGGDSRNSRFQCHQSMCGKWQRKIWEWTNQSVDHYEQRNEESKQLKMLVRKKTPILEAKEAGEVGLIH